MTKSCNPGEHRTLVMISTGNKPENIHSPPYICLNCGQGFAVVPIHTKDKDIDKVLKLAAKQTKDNLKTLRVK